ncbi:hypothetical protein ACFL3V_03895 [Nanoarchaeota archaeon]
MAPKSKKGKTVDKWRKKKYFSVVAPKVFQERELGQTLAYDSNSIKGRSMTANLMALTGNMRKQEVAITFNIYKVQGDTGYTMVEKYAITPSAIKRKVRRMRDRVDESFTCVTKDNRITRLKPLVITQVKTSKSVKCALRKRLIQFVINSVRKMEYEYLVNDIINEKLQREIARMLNKIVPIKFVYMRQMQLIGDQEGTAETATETPAEPAKEEPKKEVPVEKAEAPVEKTEAPIEKTEAPVEKAEAPAEKTEAPAEEPAPEKPSEAKEEQEEVKPAEA